LLLKDNQFSPMAPSVSAAELFPFAEYFSDAAQPLFKGERYEEDLEKAQVRLAAGLRGVWVSDWACCRTVLRCGVD
jgi:hypothetical protein